MRVYWRSRSVRMNEVTNAAGDPGLTRRNGSASRGTHSPSPGRGGVMYGFMGGGGQPVSGSVYVTGFTLASVPRSAAISVSLVSPTIDFSSRRITSATERCGFEGLHARV